MLRQFQRIPGGFFHLIEHGPDLVKIRQNHFESPAGFIVAEIFRFPAGNLQEEGVPADGW